MTLVCCLILLKLDRRYIEGQMRQIYFSGSLQCRAAGYLKMLGKTSRVLQRPWFAGHGSRREMPLSRLQYSTAAERRFPAAVWFAASGAILRHQFAVVWVVLFAHKAAYQAHGLVDAAPFGVFVPAADVLGVVEVEPVFGEQPYVQAELA